MTGARPFSSPRTGTPGGACFAVVTIVIVCAVFVLNNLAPYLGLNYAGAMTMYSGLSETGDNHLFIPKLALFARWPGIPLFESGLYVAVVEVDAARDRGAPVVRLFQRLATRDGGERPLVHLDTLRYHVNQACTTAPTMDLEMRLLTETGRSFEIDDACADPAMRRYAVVSSYPACKNRLCKRVFEWWQENAEDDD